MIFCFDLPSVFRLLGDGFLAAVELALTRFVMFSP